MTTELNPGWRWENFEQLRSTVVTAPNGVEYELRPGDITHPRAQRLLDAMFAALTQRPAAQTEREAFESAALAKWGQLDFKRSEVEPEMYYNQRLDDAWIGFGFAVAWLRASLPAPQQATPASGNILTDAFNEVQALKQQATPEPLIVKGAMAGMVDAQVRDLWPTKGATPEPVGDVAAWQRRDRNIVTGEWSEWHEDDDIEEVLDPEWAERRPLFTRPAPGVPESPCQLRKRFEQHMRDVFACNDTAFLSIDGGKTYLDGGMDNHLRTWLAASSATPEPVGEPVAQVSDLFPSVRNKLHAQGFDSDAPLFTRPAPGVPEGFALVPVEPTPQMTTLVEHDMWDKPFVNGADVWSAVLAAAQAKGDQP